MPAHRRIFDRKVLYPGDVLIREDDYGDSAYYVQSGQVGIYKRVGDEEILITVLPGNSIVGEMALIDDCRRSATVRCLETAAVIVVDRTTFERKLARLDPFVKALLEMFTQKIRRLNNDYCEVEKKLQWLLRQTGLPSHSPHARKIANRDQPASAAEPPAPTPPRPEAGNEASARAAVSELSQESIDRFDRFKLELAMLYHPDCTGLRANEPLRRSDVFHEIWAVLQKIEDDYRTEP